MTGEPIVAQALGEVEVETGGFRVVYKAALDGGRVAVTQSVYEPPPPPPKTTAHLSSNLATPKGRLLVATSAYLAPGLGVYRVQDVEDMRHQLALLRGENVKRVTPPTGG